MTQYLSTYLVMPHQLEPERHEAICQSFSYSSPASSAAMALRRSASFSLFRCWCFLHTSAFVVCNHHFFLRLFPLLVAVLLCPWTAASSSPPSTSSFPSLR